MNLNIWTRLAAISDRTLGIVAGVLFMLNFMQLPYQIVVVAASLAIVGCSLVLTARLRVYGPQPGKGLSLRHKLFRSPVFPLLLGALPLLTSIRVWQFLITGLVLLGLWIQWLLTSKETRGKLPEPSKPDPTRRG